MPIKPELPPVYSNRLPPAQAQQPTTDEQKALPTAKSLHERQQERLQDMQMSATQIQQMKKANSPKQQAANRAALLAQRLQMLKSMLSKLPPGDYKVLLQEIKQIAKELKALSAQLKTSPAGGSLPGLSAAMSQAGANLVTPDANLPSDAGAAVGGAAEAAMSAPVDVPPNVDSVPDASVEAEGVVVDESAEADVKAEAQAATAAAETAAQQASATENNQRPEGLAPASGKDDDAADKQLREVLNEAKKLLKEVLNLLKAKHQDNDKESRKLVNEIEREIEGLEQALAQNQLSSDLPEAIADSSAGDVDIDSAGLGGFVDIIA